jgi:hypothetical protein
MATPMFLARITAPQSNRSTNKPEIEFGQAAPHCRIGTKAWRFLSSAPLIKTAINWLAARSLVGLAVKHSCRKPLSWYYGS